MIKSMTAFGRAKAPAEDKDITVEIRSVNSRYFDCTVKAPRLYTPLEERIRTYLQKEVISRGKVDVFISVDFHGEEKGTVEPDLKLAGAYLAAMRHIGEEYGLRDDITLSVLARNGDLFRYSKSEEDLEAEWSRLFPVLEAAASEFSERRTKEGRKTEEDIREKLSLLMACAERVGALSEADKAGYFSKLEAKIRQVFADYDKDPDEARLLTEVALYADRVAVDEELARLKSHRAAFLEILASPEPAGRRLDFLLQEINREINTIGSKASHTEVAHLVVTMKGEVEKIREQVQNVE